MFHNIPAPIRARMQHLERIDAQDRTDGTVHSRRLRQISPETGKLLAIMAAGAPPGQLVEIGASAGYSALWLALAAQASGRRITTFEMAEHKAALAGETFETAGLEDTVLLIRGNALEHLPEFEKISFCFLDADKEYYGPCYESVVPKLVPGGLLVADNIISHRAILQTVVDRARSDQRVDAVVVSVDNGLLVCRAV